MSPRIAIATASSMITPDEDELLLLPLMPDAQLVAWDAPGVDWSAFDVVVLRSTWNYTDHLEAFLEWAHHVDTVSRLINPLSVVTWNTDKRYLADLAALGIPVVPTTYVAPGETWDDAALAGHVVVKPTVGAGSKGAKLFYGEPDAAAAHLRELHSQGRTAMIQPYLAEVDTAGETALVFIGGAFSHAARKAPILSQDISWSTGLYADEKITPSTPDAGQLALAEQVVAALPGLVEGGSDIAYARVDLLPTPAGPVLLELELTEPSLFLAMDPEAPARAARAFNALV